jgi:uncharacterized membrane protein
MQSAPHSCIEMSSNENRRRSLVKALVWRFIGIIWTWIGAYIIVLLIPPSKKTAGLIATLIVIYHHSTRMVMYYFYERIWASVAWGRTEFRHSLSTKAKLAWFIGVVISVFVIFYLIIYVTPWFKNK